MFGDPIVIVSMSTDSDSDVSWLHSSSVVISGPVLPSELFDLDVVFSFSVASTFFLFSASELGLVCSGPSTGDGGSFVCKAGLSVAIGVVDLLIWPMSGGGAGVVSSAVLLFGVMLAVPCGVVIMLCIPSWLDFSPVCTIGSCGVLFSAGSLSDGVGLVIPLAGSVIVAVCSGSSACEGESSVSKVELFVVSVFAVLLVWPSGGRGAGVLTSGVMLFGAVLGGVVVMLCLSTCLDFPLVSLAGSFVLVLVSVVFNGLQAVLGSCTICSCDVTFSAGSLSDGGGLGFPLVGSVTMVLGCVVFGLGLSVGALVGLFISTGVLRGVSWSGSSTPVLMCGCSFPVSLLTVVIVLVLPASTRAFGYASGLQRIVSLVSLIGHKFCIVLMVSGVTCHSL